MSTRSLLTVLEMHLNSRAVRDLTHPQIQILALTCLKEEDIVAVVKFGELVELGKSGLGVELGVFAAMRHHRGKIVQQMTMSSRVIR